MQTQTTLGEWIASKWWLFVLVGGIAIVAGVLALAYPGITLRALGIILGAYLLIWGILVGIADLVRAMESTGNRGLIGLLGTVSIVVGVIILANPDIGLTTLALLVGLGLLVRGMLEIVVGLTLRGLRPTTP